MDHKQRLLERLLAIGQSMKATGNGLALLGLGSAGLETNRMDEYSDLDFFAIVKPGCKRQFIEDLTWLTSIHPAANYFLNTTDGYKLLYTDEIFCEFAVFEPDELATIPFSPGQIIWQEEGFDASVLTPKQRALPEAEPSIEFRLGEAITNLYVGLGRYHRGEKLSAASFIQNYAVHQILELSRHIETEQPADHDQFNSERRFEQRFPGVAALLPQFIQGYDRSRESAVAILDFLDLHFEVNETMKGLIRRLAQQ
jgi:hypothetical protein